MLTFAYDTIGSAFQTLYLNIFVESLAMSPPISTRDQLEVAQGAMFVQGLATFGLGGLGSESRDIGLVVRNVSINGGC